MTDIPDARPPEEDVDTGLPRGLLPGEAPRSATPRAWRLTFRYGPEGIRLAASQRVAMVAPPDDSDLTYAGRAGTWVEIRDAEGHGIYRQVLTDPVRRGYEAHSPDPATGSQHATVVETPRGAFSVVVPDLPGAHDVVLHRLPDEEPADGTDAPEADEAAGVGRRSAGARPSVARPVLVEPLVETGPFEVT